VRPEGLCQLNTPITPSGIEHAKARNKVDGKMEQTKHIIITTNDERKLTVTEATI
jgi:hypothetical protein